MQAILHMKNYGIEWKTELESRRKIYERQKQQEQENCCRRCCID